MSPQARVLQQRLTPETTSRSQPSQMGQSGAGAGTTKASATPLLSRPQQSPCRLAWTTPHCCSPLALHTAGVETSMASAVCPHRCLCSLIFRLVAPSPSLSRRAAGSSDGDTTGTAGCRAGCRASCESRRAATQRWLCLAMGRFECGVAMFMARTEFRQALRSRRPRGVGSRFGWRAQCI